MRPEIILGPPGTGKTKNLLDVVEEELAAGTAPERIGLITFTKKGAREATERACEKFGLSKSQFRWFRTIHSLCFQSLGLSNGDILEGKKMVEFGDWLGVDVSESVAFDEGSTFGFTDPDRALFMENLARVRCIPLRKQYDENCDDLDWILVERISKGLAQFKRDRHLIDYTDMLQMFVDQAQPLDLDVLIVDEAQDLSRLQWLVVLLLASSCRRVVIAGDDDQAIYKWAGADVDFFIALEGQSRVLGQSFRVPSRVQRISAEVIARVHHRRPKEWLARKKDGAVVQGHVYRPMTFYDADFSGRDILVLGRNAYVLRPVLSYLRTEGIVYEWRGRNSVKASILDAVILWERLRSGESLTADECRDVYQYLSSGRGVARGYKTLPGLQNSELLSLKDLKERGGLLRDEIWHEALDRIPEDDRNYMLRARRRGESLKKKPRVRVSTIHGAKGGQAEHVILLRDMATRTYQEMLNNPEDEARVWYVGATRSLEMLSVVAPRSRECYDV